MKAPHIRLRDQNDREVIRGRTISARIADQVQELRAKGKRPVEVRVASHVADDMRAFFSSFAQFDGVLPERVHGVPFAVGGTGGQDLVIQCDDSRTN